jgi:hypothetical protein
VQRRNDGASGGNVGEANIKVGVIETLHALPAEHLSRPIVRFLSVYDSWLALTMRITFNLSIWLFWLAMCYLLFFWKRNSNQLDSR